jgi:ribosome-associated protein
MKPAELLCGTKGRQKYGRKTSWVWCETRGKVGTNILLKVKSRSALVQGTTATLVVESRRAAFAAGNAAEAKKAHGTVILDVSQVTLLADYFVITGGDTANQVRAVVEAIDQELARLGYPLRATEGKTESRWVLLDYGDIIVHVLQEKERSFYKLEQFWNHALIVDRKKWLTG